MPVYIDFQQNRLGRMKMSHMIADSLDELHAMADRLGLKRAWFQVSRSGIPHYDICQSKRSLALGYGAIELERREYMGIASRIRGLSNGQRHGRTEAAESLRKDEAGLRRKSRHAADR